MILRLMVLFGLSIAPVIEAPSPILLVFQQPCTPISCSDMLTSYLGQDFLLIANDTRLFVADNHGWRSSNPPDGWGQVTVGSNDVFYVFGPYTRQIHRSLDGGRTWSLTGEAYFGNSGGSDALFASPISGTLFMRAIDIPSITTHRGIYKSADNGATWARVLSEGNGTSVSFSPRFAEDGTAFASLEDYHYSVGIWKTVDWGETWFPVNDGLYVGGCSAGYLWVAVSPQFDQDQTVFTSDCTGAYKSTNGGQSWTMVQTIQLHQPIVFSPNYLYDQTLLIGDYFLGLFVSHDGGLTMQKIASEPVFAWGIRRQGPFPSSITTTPPSGAYVTYLPLVSHESTALEFWTIRSAAYFSPCYLYRSHDYGATWEEVPVFEATNWLYLPAVVH